MKKLKPQEIMEKLFNEKQLHERLRSKLEEEMSDIDWGTDQLVIKMTEFLKERLGGHSPPRDTSMSYWTYRGYTEPEAYKLSKEIRASKPKRLSPYSREFWMKKMNPLTGKEYTAEEADYERNSRRPIRPEYWIKKGLTEEDAIIAAKGTKDKNNRSGAKNRDKEHFKKHTVRCKEYWILRGFTEEEAKDKVKRSQSVFSLEKQIEKYGEEKGRERWTSRQQQWLKTLNDKTDEEKSLINAKKLGKGYVISRAEQEIFNFLSEKFHDVQRQFTIQKNNTNAYVYDIRIGKKIIEYNGDFWHCNPRYYTADNVNKRTKLTASQQWEKDADKRKIAEEKGYELLVIWEYDFNEDKEREMNRCIHFLTA